jgi:hypothetical protein
VVALERHPKQRHTYSTWKFVQKRPVAAEHPLVSLVQRQPARENILLQRATASSLQALRDLVMAASREKHHECI